jgi:hypothetical protein
MLQKSFSHGLQGFGANRKRFEASAGALQLIGDIRAVPAMEASQAVAPPDDQPFDLEATRARSH